MNPAVSFPPLKRAGGTPHPFRRPGFAAMLIFSMLTLSLPGLDISAISGTSGSLPCPVLKVSFEEREYDMLEKGLFGRTSEAVQKKVMEWAEGFKKEFGEEAFDALLDRYTKTPRFEEKALRAYEFQFSEVARATYAEIEILSRLIPETFSRWKRLARDSRRDRRTVSRNLAETVKRLRDEADNCFAELRNLVEKHNRLVANYNTRYLGGLEFYSGVDLSGI